ncbi:MAG: YciI family protein, partial [Nostocoides sp.]
EMEGRGVLLHGDRLRYVSTATTVRVRSSELLVSDGPFAETKEQVAGYDLLECRDLDEAIAVAAAHPTTGVGSIEVRPLQVGAPTVDLPEPDSAKQRYLLLICAAMGLPTDAALSAAPPEGAADSDRTPAHERESGADHDEDEDIDRWVDDLDSRGVRLFGWPLQHPSTAVTVRRQNGRTITLDGPFAETKEQIAGYDLLECADLDEALAAAAAHPVAAVGTVEVRPLWAS